MEETKFSVNVRAVESFAGSKFHLFLIGDFSDKKAGYHVMTVDNTTFKNMVSPKQVIAFKKYGSWAFEPKLKNQ